MFRLSLAALCLTVASPVVAGDPKLREHNHGYAASFTAPINYRPNNGAGELIVRTPGYSEAATKIVRSGKVGVTTGTSVSPQQGVTVPGRHSTGKLILVDNSAMN